MEVAGKLRELMAAQLGMPDLAFVAAPAPLRGGHSAELFAFRLSGAPEGFAQPLVLRLISDETRASREVAAQSAAVAGGFPAPAIRLHGDAQSVFGRSFIVMDMIDGRTPMAAAGVRGLPRLFRELPGMLADAMAQLHDVDIDPEIADVSDELLDEVREPAARAWLTAHRPVTGRRVICHCDLHGENVLVRDGELVAVVDWELATAAPPELDVARTRLILATLPGISNVARRALQRKAARTSEDFTEAYTRVRPVDPERLRWYDVLWAARQAAIGDRDDAIGKVWRPVRGALDARVAAFTA